MDGYFYIFMYRKRIFVLYIYLNVVLLHHYEQAI